MVGFWLLWLISVLSLTSCVSKEIFTLTSTQSSTLDLTDQPVNENSTSHESVTHQSLNPQSTESKNHNESHWRLQVLSSKNRVHFYVNNEKIIFDIPNNITTEMHKMEGLHFIALNPKSGRIVMKRFFATTIYAEDIGIPPLLNTLKSGEVVVFAVKFDAALNLSRSIRKLFLSLGLMMIHTVSFRNYFVCAFIRGGKVMLETIIDDDPNSVGDYASSPLQVELLIPRNLEASCWDDKDKTEILRSQFCYKYGGYGTLCNCESPLDININPPKIEGSIISDVPFMIITKNRPHTLFRCILTILQQPGGHKSNIFVVTDGYHEETIDLLHLMEITYIIHDTHDWNLPENGARIAYHYRFALNVTLHTFTTAEFVIVLEDDLLAAPDFVSFFNQTASVLASDPSLYCINGWNELSAMHTGGSPYKVMRQETLPTCGWMMTRELWKEAIKKWPDADGDFGWDAWFKGITMRSTRECLVPEISRTFHAGESGIHIHGQMTLSHFSGHLVTSQKLIRLHNVNRLIKTNYEEDLYATLEKDDIVFLDPNVPPCHPKFISRDIKNKTIIIFFTMSSTDDDLAWHRLSSCLGVFNLDIRNSHRGLLNFYFYNTRILAVGYPYSPYSYLKPHFVTPLSAEQNEWEEEHLAIASLMNRRRFRVPAMERMLPNPLNLDVLHNVPNIRVIKKIGR